MRKRFSLEDDEAVSLKCAGALCIAPSERWRLGIWMCTNARVLFLQGDNAVFSAALDDLISVELCEREYSFGKKPCLKNTYREKEGERTFWLMTPDIKEWRLKLTERFVGTMPEAFVAEIAKELNSDAEELVWFLYRRQCATIGELAAKIGAENHMDVLQKIRREINPVSEKLTGQPAFVFRRYKWWFAGDGVVSEPFSDVIDEGDFYRVIVEAPDGAKMAIEGDVLMLIAADGFKCEVHLPKDATRSLTDGSYRNGIREFVFKKMGC